ncbi:MAG TPA: ferredoxin [Patescibacteria group bacterium]|jgi:ferredoxin|nr:ferredoxin [Patescibacteria group bacterium]
MADNPKIERKIRKLTMRIDQSLCIGAATCIAIAPKAWALDDEAKAIILDTVEEETDEALLEAAKGCPVMAIIITDEHGKQIFP